ncbi:MAG TPA: NRDE family protein, partial [Thermoanaerobaculia bacterium]|nr:NRDE family protein [Thermoanaerobaculia bacterium]
DVRSRGLLVGDFVETNEDGDAFARSIDGAAYAGFHLIAGTIGGTFVHVSNADGGVRAWAAGIHGISNGRPGVLWPKVERATAHVQEIIASHDYVASLASDLLRFLGTPGDAARDRGATLRDEIEGEVFVMSDRYGTRSSTVVVATPDDILFFEQNYGPNGAKLGGVSEFVIPR